MAWPGDFKLSGPNSQGREAPTRRRAKALWHWSRDCGLAALGLCSGRVGVVHPGVHLFLQGPCCPHLLPCFPSPQPAWASSRSLHPQSPSQPCFQTPPQRAWPGGVGGADRDHAPQESSLSLIPGACLKEGVAWQASCSLGPPRDSVKSSRHFWEMALGPGAILRTGHARTCGDTGERDHRTQLWPWPQGPRVRS